MFTSNSQHTFVPNLVNQSLLLLLILSLLAGTLAAQTEEEKSRASAMQIIRDGLQLRSEGSKESLQSAVRKFAEALPLFRSLHDAYWEATTLHIIGATYHQLGEYRQALDYFTRALPLRRAVDDRAGEGATLSNMGVVYGALEDRRTALAYLTQALLLVRAVGDRAGEAVTLDNMGRTYDAMGERRKALDYYGQSLVISRERHERLDEAATLENIAQNYFALGEIQPARDYFEQALLIFRALGDRKGEALALTEISKAYALLGETQKSLDHSGQAIVLFREIGQPEGEATPLSTLGFVYASIGEPLLALNYYQQALTLYRGVDNHKREATMLNNIGEIYQTLTKIPQALDYYSQSLQLRRAVGDRGGEAVTLANLGSLYAALREKQLALDFFNQALPILHEIGDRSGEARTLGNIARVYIGLRENRKALNYLMQSLTLSRTGIDKEAESVTLFYIARVELDEGRLDAARDHLESAVEVQESLRTKIGSQQLRSSYFVKAQVVFEAYIDLLMRLHKQKPSAGFDGKALQTSERGRARSLLEMLSEASADIRQGVDPQLVEHERSLRQQLNARAEQLRILTGPNAGEQATAITKEIESLTTDLNQVEAQIRLRSPRYAALTQPQPLDTKGIQAQLDADTLLLEYSLGPEHSYLWLVSPTEIKSFELPPRKEIETAANRFTEVLKTEKSFYPDPDQKRPASAKVDIQRQELLENASHLSQMLLGPVALQLGQKRLVIVADGALQYLPFAALPDPARPKQPKKSSQPLILQHEIVSLPSMSVLPSLRIEVTGRKPAPKDIVVLADPVFSSDDERVKRGTSQGKPDKQNGPETLAELAGTRAARESGKLRGGNRLERLPETRKEADGIVALVPANRAEEALDFAASRELVNSGGLSQYRYITFATHGLLDSEHPELTAIALSLVDENGNRQNGYLRAHEIYNLNLSAELVVLSACETALGKDVKGEGLIGLTRGFMYAGAPRVVASLWSVNDDSTTALMVSFYRGMIKDHKRPAEALRAAQIEMLKSEKWQAPHYWAPFVLQGEWR